MSSSGEIPAAELNALFAARRMTLEKINML